MLPYLGMRQALQARGEDMAEDQESAAQGSIDIHLVSKQPVCESNPDAKVVASLATRWNT